MTFKEHAAHAAVILAGFVVLGGGLYGLYTATHRLTEPVAADYQLTPLFSTSEGCTAYRFRDDGAGAGASKIHYFVACKEDKTAEIIDILKEDSKVPTVKPPPRPIKKAVPK